MNNQIARRIRGFRKLKGLTQTELADSVFVSVAVIGAVERGARKADSNLIRRISATLNIDEQELTGSLHE